MAVFDPDSSTEDATTEEPTVEDYSPTTIPDKETSTVNSRYTKLTSLITNLSGYSWTVLMYHQILGDNDSPQPHSIDIDPVLQQYYKISNFEIRVSDPLSYQYVTALDSDGLEGSGYIYPGTIIPQRGDTFVADVGDGRTGIFNITNVTPRSMYMDRAYEVAYYMTSYSTTPILDDLNTKSVKVGLFSKNYLQHGLNPIIEENEIRTIADLERLKEELVGTWSHDFIDRTVRHVLIPGQIDNSLDLYLLNYISRTINTSTVSALREANWPSINQLDVLRLRSLWDVLLESNPSSSRLYSGQIEKRMKLISTWVLKSTPVFTGIFYSKIKEVLWPNSQVGSYEVTDIQPIEGETTYYQNYEVGEFIPVDDSDPVQKPDIYSVTVDDYYVFSSAFYTGERFSQSKLEYLTTLYLDNEQINPADVLKLAENSYSWGGLERFYYTPVLWLLIDYVIKSRSTHG